MRKAGLILAAMGLVFLTAAGNLAIRNLAEDARAGAASARALSVVEKAIQEAEPAQPVDQVWLGRLRIPTLELELPIFAQWSYENLKTALNYGVKLGLISSIIICVCFFVFAEPFSYIFSYSADRRDSVRGAGCRNVLLVK